MPATKRSAAAPATPTLSGAAAAGKPARNAPKPPAPTLTAVRVVACVPLLIAVARPAALVRVGDAWQQWAVSDSTNRTWLTAGWALTDTRLALTIAAAYMAFAAFVPVLRLPDMSKVMKPVKLLYNTVQVLLCLWMTISAVGVALDRRYSLVCNEFNTSKLDVANVLWYFYASKVLDMVDTVIIVATHKWDQLTFLHVYHHASIFLMYWLNITRGYDGDVYATIVLNSFIHFLMYSYYNARTLGIPVPGLIKKAMTMSQLVQFVGMMVQASLLLGMSCPYPKNIVSVYLGYIFSLFLLFSRFFVLSYMQKPKATKALSAAAGGAINTSSAG